MISIQGQIFDFHDANEFEGLSNLQTEAPATYNAVDAFSVPLQPFATMGELGENPNMEAELALVPNTNMGGLFDIFKGSKKPKKTKILKQAAPAPMQMPMPQPKINSFVDQYGKYVVVGVGTVALIAVVALLMTKQGKK